MTERPHGYNRYKTDGCRCLTCRVDHAARLRAYRSGSARPGFVPVGPVRDHIAALSAAGVGRRQLAQVAGVYETAIRRWMRGHVKSVARVQAERVLAVSADQAAQRWLPAVGTKRRLRALVRLGWTTEALASRIGWTTPNFAQLLRRDGVQRATAAKARALYDDLSLAVPADSFGTRRARLRATRQMWFPPLAWDDDTIDDPDALPCLLPPVGRVDRDLELLVQHVVAGHPVEPTMEARAEIVRRMLGRRLADVAEAARCSTRRVHDLRVQMTGRPT